ncbi:GntR family transcriptional regulator [Jannaschia donghaensis]|uniref:Putative HTH-type transcriptional regulator YdfH n=1 Tax=Jannaschia donghaensis TaxID=420998 RepID=A0A0M6YHS7_9RHOB|nr:GntR family transcriptional regulator [Jannaschia donghaensis]CTQ49235.1 putative HTH-type transcriptional regulator YdfH [Jannaschia donghaensis]
MNMTSRVRDRRTSVDDVFDDLYAQITSLNLRPGDKISEADVAAKFGVSRQPVRDAFSRLANLDLLLIRPQRATIVRRFSLREVAKARFVRAAVEAEVLRRAADIDDADGVARLDACLTDQAAAVEARDYKAFGALDYAFHEAICDVAGVDFAFEIITAEKAKVDRLCLLSLAKEDRMPQLLDDHTRIVDAIRDGDADRAVAAGMLHLTRLDETIEAIVASNAEYFDLD